MSSQPDGPTGHMIGRKTEDADIEEEALFREKSGILYHRFLSMSVYVPLLLPVSFALSKKSAVEVS